MLSKAYTLAAVGVRRPASAVVTLFSAERRWIDSQPLYRVDAVIFCGRSKRESLIFFPRQTDIVYSRIPKI